MAVTDSLAAHLPVPGAYQAFQPEVGGHIVVQLGGETMRCPVHKVVSDDAVLVKIDSVPMAKTHSFRFEDIVGVRRRVVNARDVWEAQSDRDFLAEQARLAEAAKKRPVKRGKR